MLESDKEKYSTIEITDDEDEGEKNFFTKTLEIPKIILEKKKKPSKIDNFARAVRYNPSPKYGLSQFELDERKINNLYNRQTVSLSKPIMQILLENIITFFNIVLVVLAILFISVGKFNECFFLIIAIVNTAIGIFQEIRAKKIVDKLQLTTNPEVKVIRGGKKMKIPTTELVLDDVFFLTAGSEIPCDAFIIDDKIAVNESSLTGESHSVKKKVGDYVLAGSYVVEGSCICRCDRIGEHNYISQLQTKAKKVKKVKSILLDSLNKIISLISMFIVPVAIILAIKNFNTYKTLANGANFVLEETYNSVNQYIMFNVIEKTGASIVTLIPAGLFLLISTTLAVSVIRLGQRKTAVQDSYAIESLARTNVLCLDKTGTITDGTMNLEKTIKLTDEEIDVEKVMGRYLYCFEDNNVTSLALKKYFKGNDELRVINKLPFSSARKYSAVEFVDGGTYILGAPDFVLKNKDLIKEVEIYLEQGLRVLSLARTSEKINEEGTFENNEPIAFFVLSDHIREEAYDTIKWFNDNEVEIKIISGDNPMAVSKIAQIAGVKNFDKFISLEGLSNDKVASICNDYTVFGRVSPEQKAVLIKALKTSGKTVAMTGDGVNDILAMKQANCSIAMASGAEAARHASHIVLMDSNFNSLPQVIAEGRQVINNVQRSASLFLMKTIYSALLTSVEILMWIITGIIKTDYRFANVFSPSSYYMLEFLVIGIPSFFLAMQPNKALIKGNFNTNVLSKALPAGITLLLGVLIIMFGSNFPWLDIPTNSDNIKSLMATLILSITGFGILCAICMPFDKRRFLIFSGMVLVGIFYIIVLLIPMSFPGVDISLSSLELKHWLTILIIVAIDIIFYASFMAIEKYHAIKKVKSK